VLALDVVTDIAQGGSEVGHQWMTRVLAEDRGDLRGADLRELCGGPRTALAEALGQAGGDREVTAAAGALADRRPPTGAEVDRVEAEDKGGTSLAPHLDQIGRGIGRKLLHRAR
jgi:hypothetical protein